MLLGIARAPNTRELEREFRRLAKRLHPDKTDNVNGHAQFIALRSAYETRKAQLVRDESATELTAKATEKFRKWQRTHEEMERILHGASRDSSDDRAVKDPTPPIKDDNDHVTFGVGACVDVCLANVGWTYGVVQSAMAGGLYRIEMHRSVERFVLARHDKIRMHQVCCQSIRGVVNCTLPLDHTGSHEVIVRQPRLRRAPSDAPPTSGAASVFVYGRDRMKTTARRPKLLVHCPDPMQIKDKGAQSCEWVADVPDELLGVPQKTFRRAVKRLYSVTGKGFASGEYNVYRDELCINADGPERFLEDAIIQPRANCLVVCERAT